MKNTKALFGILTIAVCLAFGQKIEAASFLTTGSMTNPRYHHTATLLPSGQVLVAGGSGSGNANYLSSAELYNPTNGTWAPANPMTSIRFCHTATLLTNGQVLVAGGYRNSSYLSSAELYDPATGTWAATNPMTRARNQHTATLLANGLVLVAGGNDGSVFLSSAELYNPATGQWTATGSMATNRSVHTATLLPSGKVLAAGGYGTGLPYHFNSSAELYDPSSGTWSPAGAMSTVHAQFTATLLPSGKVLVAGGVDSNDNVFSSADLYNAGSGTWTATGSMTTNRAHHKTVLLPNGLVLVAGGTKADLGGELSSAELYDSASGTWTATGSMANLHKLHTATLLPNGLVLVVGGQIGNGPSSTATANAELYVPDPPLDLTNGLVAYYPFNGNANDASGKGNNGTVVGASLATDRFGQANRCYSFGINNHIDLGSGIHLGGPQTGWSAAVWFKTTETSPFGVGTFLTDHNPIPDPHMYSTHFWLGQGKLGMNCNNDVSPAFFVRGTTALNDGLWHFGVFVADGNSKLKLYADGRLDGEAAYDSSLNYDGDPFWRVNYVNNNSSDSLVGSIDDVRIYSRALSGSEVQQLYVYESEPFCSPHKATATAVMYNEFVVDATVTDGGCGYTNAPTVLIQGGGGSGATAYAVVSNGEVVDIVFTSAGGGYTNAPRIVIGSPPFVPTVSIAVSKVKVTQNVVLGRNYVLEASTDLVTWTATGPQFTAEAESIVTEFDVDVTGRFFRIRQVP